ncbi:MULTISPECIES: PAS domain-containing protein [Streptomyces]|uniref:PAS domain-containing protein n=1 Tax=Streptomyces TaxID=1883 RepID=UPI000AAF3031|nr:MULTISPECIES: PAS domain-containing protein [Streptomyces]
MSTEPADRATSLLDTLRIGIVMLDEEGTVLLWSPTTQEICGWSPQEVTGHRLEEFIAGDDEERRTRAEVLRRTHEWRGGMRLRHRDGGLVEVEGRGSVLQDTEGRSLVLATLMETRRIKAVEHDLAALDGLFVTSPLGIALFDTGLRYVRWNEALLELNSATGRDLLGQTVADVLPPGLAEEVLRIQAGVLETGRPVVDMIMPAPYGPGARSLSYGQLTDRAGQVVGVSCTVMDVTERLEALNKAEAARGRLALLDDLGVALGDRLDVRAISQAIASVLVPRFADYAGVLLRGEVADGGDLPEQVIPMGTPLHLLGFAARHAGGAGRAAAAARTRGRLRTGLAAVPGAGFRGPPDRQFAGGDPARHPARRSQGRGRIRTGRLLADGRTAARPGHRARAARRQPDGRQRTAGNGTGAGTVR